MGKVTSLHDAIEKKGTAAGWVDRALSRYKLARPAIRKVGNLDRSITVADACSLMDEMIKARESTARHQDRTWQPKHSHVLSLLSKQIVDPLLSTMLANDAAQDAIEVHERPEDPTEATGKDA